MAATVVNIEDRIAATSNLFVQHIWPIISHKFGTGTLIPVEGRRDDELATNVDYCGIDYFFKPTKESMFGIGQRVQTRPRSGGRAAPWNSFTMSIGTYGRVLKARARPFGQLIPAVLVQSYVTETLVGLDVDAVGVVRTRELLEYAATLDKQHVRSSTTGSFCYWTFDELTEAGVNVDRLPAPGLRSPV